MTTRSGPAASGTSRQRYWPGFSCLSPNASIMSMRAWLAASLASMRAWSVSNAFAGMGATVDARTHDPVSASTSARRFILHLTLLLDFCGGNAWPPSRVPLTVVWSWLKNDRDRTIHPADPRTIQFGLRTSWLTNLLALLTRLRFPLCRPADDSCRVASPQGAKGALVGSFGVTMPSWCARGAGSAALCLRHCRVGGPAGPCCAGFRWL